MASGELPSLLLLWFSNLLSGDKYNGAITLLGALKWHYEVT